MFPSLIINNIHPGGLILYTKIVEHKKFLAKIYNRNVPIHSIIYLLQWKNSVLLTNNQIKGFDEPQLHVHTVAMPPSQKAC